MRPLQILCALTAVALAFALLVSALAVLGTLAMRARQKSRAGVLRVSRLGGLMLASVFLGFQKIVHPHVRHAIVQEVKDDEGAGDEADSLYREQLRRIRRGEEAGELELVQGSEDRSC